MELTYLGHACFMMVVEDTKLLFDPFISPNPLAAEVDIDGLNPDYILISHGHEDHVADAEHIAKNSGATLVATFEIATWFQNKGIQNVQSMNIGGELSFSFGKVKMVNALHSSILPDGSYGGNPAGFVVQTKDKTAYYAGDTGLALDMKLIGEEFNIDVALLPVGNVFTMGIEDAVKAARFVETSTIVGMHYDTFPPIEIDHEKTMKVATDNNINLILPRIGETINL